MTAAYRAIAYLVAVLVVVQSAASVFASSGLRIWVREGNVLDEAALDSGDLPFTGAGGLVVHSVTGMHTGRATGRPAATNDHTTSPARA